MSEKGMVIKNRQQNGDSNRRIWSLGWASDLFLTDLSDNLQVGGSWPKQRRKRQDICYKVRFKQVHTPIEIKSVNFDDFKDRQQMKVKLNIMVEKISWNFEHTSLITSFSTTTTFSTYHQEIYDRIHEKASQYSWREIRMSITQGRAPAPPPSFLGPSNSAHREGHSESYTNTFQLARCWYVQCKEIMALSD